MGKFKRGDQVEVCGKEEGFRNSYYPATIISEINPNEFIVQYNTLLTPDELHPHREFLSGDDLRTVPPEIEMNKLNVEDEVDAFANEGWWKGKVKKIVNGRGRGRGRRVVRYHVSFEDNGQVEVDNYCLNDLRLHQDWIHGKWSSTSKNN